MSLSRWLLAVFALFVDTLNAAAEVPFFGFLLCLLLVLAGARFFWYIVGQIRHY